MRRLAMLPLLLTGCVLAIDGTTTITDEVDQIVVRLSNGDVAVDSEPGQVSFTVDIGGFNDDGGWQLRDGVLTIDYACGGVALCGGSLDIIAPAGVPVQAELGAGDLQLTGRRGDLSAVLGAGSLSGRDLRSESSVFAVAAGEVELDFVDSPTWLEAIVATGSIHTTVPRGPYTTELEAPVGSVHTSDISSSSDPLGAIHLVAHAGSIDLIGR